MTTGLETVWMLAILELAGDRRTAQYVGISATLAGVRGVTAPLVSGLVIEHFGVHAVYLLAAVCMASAAMLLSVTLRTMPGRTLGHALDGRVPQLSAS
jgi:MFS family permease